MARDAAIIVARLIFAGVFAMAATFKFIDMPNTATYIASIGWPAPALFAWIAAFFEVGLVLAFLTGLYFREAAIVAAAYVLFLGFAFHGPNRWQGNQAEFGFFVDHFSFFAGLLLAFAFGPGTRLVLKPAIRTQPQLRREP